MDAPETILPQNAWDDNIVDVCVCVCVCVSDVVAPYECHSSRKPQSYARPFYNKATKKETHLLPVPDQAGHHTRSHIWGDLVEKAGLKLDEIPKNWDRRVWTYLKHRSQSTAARFQGNAEEDLRLRSSESLHGWTQRRDGNNLSSDIS